MLANLILERMNYSSIVVNGLKQDFDNVSESYFIADPPIFEERTPEIIIADVELKFETPLAVVIANTLNKYNGPVEFLLPEFIPLPGVDVELFKNTKIAYLSRITHDLFGKFNKCENENVAGCPPGIDHIPKKLISSGTTCTIDLYVRGV